MKTLKFRTELVPLILSGEKTATWRLFDDKNIEAGDTIEMLEFGSLKFICVAKVNEVIEKKFKDLTNIDKEGHETYESDKAMYGSFSSDYKTEVTSETEVKVIKFSIILVQTAS